MRFLPILFLALMGILGTSHAGEIRWGIAKHDLTDTESGLNMQPQIVFDTPKLLKSFGAIRPYLTGSINTDGQLNYGGAGLLAAHHFNSGAFLEFQAGMVVHDGRVDLPPPWEPIYRQHIADTERTYGCPVLFQLSPSIGARINERLSVALYWEHLSHGKILCDNGKNEGLDSVGLRFSRRF